MVNGRPFRPLRCCRKITGPGEVSRTARAAAIMTGRKGGSRKWRPGCRRPAWQPPARIASGVGAEHHHGPAVEVIDRGAGDLGLEEIGDQPDLDAFEFAGLDDLFQLAEDGIAGGENDTVGGLLVEEADQGLSMGSLVGVDFADDADAVAVALPRVPPGGRRCPRGCRRGRGVVRTGPFPGRCESTSGRVPPSSITRRS
jgi:hypothetical protein